MRLLIPQFTLKKPDQSFPDSIFYQMHITVGSEKLSVGRFVTIHLNLPV
jgi:hypothetical protein